MAVSASSPGGSSTSTATPAEETKKEEEIKQSVSDTGTDSSSGSTVGFSEINKSSNSSTVAATSTEATPGKTNYTSKTVTRVRENIPEAEIDKVGKYDKTVLTDLLDQQVKAAQQQYNAQIDNSVDQQSKELQRALTDAQTEYQTQQNQISANEQNALDNSALYAEARGDKGGIGQAQYNSIQNTAAQNRVAVQSAQTKLSTDTARQISDLRAQGEFEKADALLDLTQSYLEQLSSIEQFAANYNLSVDQLNTAIEEWMAEYRLNVEQYVTSTEMSMAEMTGEFADGTATLKMNSNLAQLAMSLIQAGMKPSKLTDEQKAALESAYGMDADELSAYYKLLNKKKKKSYSGGGSSSSSSTTDDTTGAYTPTRQDQNALSNARNDLSSGRSVGDVQSALSGLVQNGSVSRDGYNYIVGELSK